jgi:hypothetical protein
MTENIHIKEILANPFSLRLLRDKLKIVNKVRPIPPISNLITHHIIKTEQYTRHFSISQYQKFDWLIGCETTHKLNCWPCFTFL